jgi:hypothetical protein
MSSQFDREKTKKTIACVLDKIQTDVDPHLLSKYRGVFKKEVSFFRRSWTAAYLLMLLEQGGSLRVSGRVEKNRFNKNDGEGRVAVRSQSKDDEAQRYPLPESESKRLFISIGRNRRVFPREILGLINAKTAIPKEDIGAIRILDNYSFVQVRDTVAEQIIEALNGMNFRGRTLAVNYAKSKKDEGGEDSGFDSREQFEETQHDQEPREIDEEMPDYSSADAETSKQGQYHSDKENV